MRSRSSKDELLQVFEVVKLNVVLGDLISHGLSFGHIDIVLGVSLLLSCDLFEFPLQQLLLLHLVKESMLELMCHNHVHVIRRQSTAAELDSLKVISYMLGKRLHGPFLGSFLLLLVVSFVLDARSNTNRVERSHLQLMFAL